MGNDRSAPTDEYEEPDDVGENDPQGERALFLRRIRGAAMDQSTRARPVESTRRTLAQHDRRASVRAGVGIFSLGNPCEGHGHALAPDIDDRMSQLVSIRVANATGARYLGHIPGATDRIGELARSWSPAVLPADQFVGRAIEYMKFVMQYHEPRPRFLLLLSGHGGNSAIEAVLPSVQRSLDVERCVYRLALVVPPELEAQGLNLQHAGDLEHCVAMRLGPGCFDVQAHYETNRKLATGDGFVEVLREQPALAGMAGYYILGDERFNAVRARYPGVKKSVERFAERSRIEADAGTGAEVLEHSVKVLSTQLRAMWSELGAASQQSDSVPRRPGP